MTDIADDDRIPPNGNVPRWWRFLATLGVVGLLGIVADTMQIISFDVGDVWFLTEDPEHPHPSGIGEWVGAVWNILLQIRAQAPWWFIALVSAIGIATMLGPVKVITWLIRILRTLAPFIVVACVIWLLWPWISGPAWNSISGLGDGIAWGPIATVLAVVLTIAAVLIGGVGVLLLDEFADSTGAMLVIGPSAVLLVMAIRWDSLPQWLTIVQIVALVLLIISSVVAYMHGR
ncbi:hypothetical protein [Nonomuraea sp. NPDC049129]|uniref:hypothetical protein n=1 Tax=Nonomuraea sp. NPDC049129 TaxID=3155272 RepID=UPI0033DD6253